MDKSGSSVFHFEPFSFEKPSILFLGGVGLEKMFHFFYWPTCEKRFLRITTESLNSRAFWKKIEKVYNSKITLCIINLQEIIAESYISGSVKNFLKLKRLLSPHNDFLCTIYLNAYYNFANRPQDRHITFFEFSQKFRKLASKTSFIVDIPKIARYEERKTFYSRMVEGKTLNATGQHYVARLLASKITKVASHLKSHI